MTIERPMFPPRAEKSALRVVGGVDFDPAAPQKTKLPEKNRLEDDPPALIQGGDDDAYLARTLFSRTYWTLPFVTMPAEECDSWGEFWKRVVMWNDERTDDSYADFWRGRKYAFLAIEAIGKDKTGGRQLEITVKSMIEGAFRRRGPSGKLCRDLSSAEQGFIDFLCLAITRPAYCREQAKRQGWPVQPQEGGAA
jgi:hypothetical protein